MKIHINIKSIIEKVYRDYPFEEVFEDECKEWAYEILNKIGRSEISNIRILLCITSQIP